MTAENNEREVRIRFSSIQETDGQKTDISQIVAGVRSEEEGVTVLRFTEKMEEMDATVESTMWLRPGEVTLSRTGGIASDMVFKNDNDTMCEYSTPLGMLSFVVTTNDMSLQVDENEIDIHISYDMYAYGSLVTSNELSINAK